MEDVKLKGLALGGGVLAYVDDDWYEMLKHVRWYKDRKDPGIYACVKYHGQRSEYLHQLIADPLPGMHVDHINRDTLDNRRENLRMCTPSQNGANRKLSSNNTSGFKGVSFNKKRRKWIARIKVRGKTLSLGAYYDKKEAAKCYDRWAIKYFGKFALTNEAMGLYDGTSNL